MNLSIFTDLINCTKSVLHNKQRFLITIIQFIEAIAQTKRINRPSPWCGFKIWILFPAHDAHRIHCCEMIGSDCRTAIVGERDKIKRILFKQLQIAILYLQFNTLSFKDFMCIIRIFSTRHNIDKEQTLSSLLVAGKYIFRLACCRIHLTHRKHCTE